LAHWVELPIGVEEAGQVAWPLAAPVASGSIIEPIELATDAA
jgi:hypothetical protein